VLRFKRFLGTALPEPEAYASLRPLDAGRDRLLQEDDPFCAQHFLEPGGKLGVLLREDAGPPDEDGHAAPKAVEGRGELDADGSCPQDGHGARDLREVEDALVGQRPDGADAGNGRDNGGGSRADQKPPGRCLQAVQLNGAGV
jgi:hypothetical protein